MLKIMVVGLVGEGKSTLAALVADKLREALFDVSVVDDDAEKLLLPGNEDDLRRKMRGVRSTQPSIVVETVQLAREPIPRERSSYSMNDGPGMCGNMGPDDDEDEEPGFGPLRG